MLSRSEDKRKVILRLGEGRHTEKVVLLVSEVLEWDIDIVFAMKLLKRDLIYVLNVRVHAHSSEQDEVFKTNILNLLQQVLIFKAQMPRERNCARIDGLVETFWIICV